MYFVQEVSPVLLSIGGGTRDIQVYGDLSYLPTEDDSLGFSVMSHSMPNSWLSTDHQASVWCNQIVTQVVGALYQFVHPDRLEEKGRMEKLEVIKTRFQSTLPTALELKPRSEMSPSKKIKVALILISSNVSFSLLDLP